MRWSVFGVVDVIEHRIGGAADLPQRVVKSLNQCYHDSGDLPTARRYQQWRDELQPEERDHHPSLTAVVPMAYRTWHEARVAAGLPSYTTVTNHGPVPRWDQESCLEVVREWAAEAGTRKSLAAFTEWITDQRSEGRDLPSASTIRLRMRRPWSEILLAASTDR